MENKIQPKNRADLVLIVVEQLNKHGKHVNLNFIDTSLITDMSDLFSQSAFNGDISQWDVSNVTTMNSMFSDSRFNSDISQWNVEHVKYISCMFYNSKFNGDVSLWNPKNNEHYFISSYIEKGKETQTFQEYQTHCVRQKLFNRSSCRTEAPAVKAL